MSVADAFLVAAFLFFGGSVIGWGIEVFFRRFFTAKKWINPGFLTGPYLPLYGFGVTGLFLIKLIPIDVGNYWANSVIIIAIMTAVMTLIEYIAGLIFIKGLKIKLWDYSDRRGNIQGIICPLFTFFWFLVSALYYFVIDPYVLDAVVWFVHHISFAFVIGMVCGIFLVDFAHSINLGTKISKFARSHNKIVNFESLKVSIKRRLEAAGRKKGTFVFPFKTNRTLQEELDDYAAETEPKQDNSVDGGQNAVTEG